MKLLLITAFTLTLMIQSLWAASKKPGDILSSAERTHNLAILDETKALAVQSETIIEKVLPQIPEVATCEGHREQLREFLKLAHDYKEVKCHCRKKASKFLEDLTQFMKKYSADEADTEECQEVVKLLNESGLQEMRDNVEEKRAQGEYEYLTED